MERDNQNYNRNQNYRSNDRRQDNEQFENYRDRYSSRGNYYGLRHDDDAYDNVRSSGSNNAGSGSSGGYGADSYRGASGGRQQQDYHYGDPNPYMDNDRNGGYDRTRGTGWRDNNDRYSHYGNARTNDRDSYSRQDNSYQYGDQGQGRRYSDFGRDEGRTYNQDRNRGYNMATEDSYYDRGDFKRSRSDNDYRGSRNQGRDYGQWQDRNNDRDDFRYSGRIQSTGSDRDDNYGTGLYASNRSYVSDHESNSDGDRTSSRQRRSGERSGPDYSSRSSISDYGGREYRG